MPKKTSPKNGTPLRAAIYCRKSADDKGGHDESLSVQAQQADCRKVIEREGWEFVGVHADDGISGRTWAAGKAYDAAAESDTLTNEYIKKFGRKRRPGLGQLLDRVAAGEIDVVVTRDMPRLGRPIFQSVLQNFFPQFFQSHNVSIFSLADGMIDYNDFGKSLALFLADALLDRELKTRAKHAIEGARREREKGRHFASYVPFGYDKVDRILVQNKNADLIRELFTDVSKGTPILAKVREFLDRGVKSTKGGPIITISVRQWLKNPIYMGKIAVGDKDARRLIKCTECPDPIISESLYFKVQKLLDSRKKVKSNRARTTGGLASGIISCGLCGRALCKHSTKKVNSYRCAGVQLRCRCAIGVERIEQFLMNFIPLIRVVERDKASKDAEARGELPSLYERETSLQDRARTIARKMVENPDLDMLIDAAKELSSELKKVQRRITDLENIPEVPSAGKVRIENFNALSLDVKRDAIRAIFNKIIVYPDKVTFVLSSDEEFAVLRSATGCRGFNNWLPPINATGGGGTRLEIYLYHGDFISDKKATKRREKDAFPEVHMMGGKLVFILTSTPTSRHRKA